MLKKLGLLLLILVGAGIAGVYYYWQQLTQLPAWYTSPASGAAVVGDEVRTTPDTGLAAVEQQLATAMAADPGSAPPQDLEVQLTEQDLNQLMLAAVTQTQMGQQLQTAIKGFNTTIEAGKLTTGTVINLTQIPMEPLNPQQRSLLETTLKTFPFLANREIYLGFEGHPRVVDGELVLDEQTQVNVGNLRLSLTELSQRLDIPLEELTRLRLQLGRLQVQELELQQDTAVLRGAVN